MLCVLFLETIKSRFTRPMMNTVILWELTFHSLACYPDGVRDKSAQHYRNQILHAAGCKKKMYPQLLMGTKLNSHRRCSFWSKARCLSQSIQKRELVLAPKKNNILNQGSLSSKKKRQGKIVRMIWPHHMYLNHFWTLNTVKVFETGWMFTIIWYIQCK